MFDKVTPVSVFRAVVGQLVAVAVGLGVYHISHNIVATALATAVTARIMQLAGL